MDDFLIPDQFALSADAVLEPPSKWVHPKKIAQVDLKQEPERVSLVEVLKFVPEERFSLRCIEVSLEVWRNDDYGMQPSEYTSGEVVVVSKQQPRAGCGWLPKPVSVGLPQVIRRAGIPIELFPQTRNTPN